MIKKIWKLIVKFLYDTRGAQLVEEGLLICVSLFLLTIVLGVAQSITTMIGELFSQSPNWQPFLQEVFAKHVHHVH